MRELIRTNDPVTISFAESLLKEADIAHFVADRNMSVAEGSLGVLAARIMVDPERFEQARRLAIEAGLGDELRHREGEG